MKKPKLNRTLVGSFVEFDTDLANKIRFGQEGNELFIEHEGIKHYLGNDFLSLIDNLDKRKIVTEEVTFTKTQIVGVAAGDIGHASGAPIVVGEVGTVIHLMNVMLVYTFGVAAYDGGDDDLVVSYEDGDALTPIVLKANLLTAATNKIVLVKALSATALSVTAGKGLSLRGTAYTDVGGTAVGTLKCIVTYYKQTI